ncbi:hypothetical protein F4808DRAFT_465329 [Astrocystis sublimbata]|nr:hypothetical protein F4808DRAFT_465329 [Astrocystis sublimbata]
MSSTNQTPGYPSRRPARSATSTTSTTVASSSSSAAAASHPPNPPSSQQRRQHDGDSPPRNRHKQRMLTDLESWVEVSSQPSSSSVSSIGDEIDTTGLQVGSSEGPRRRRNARPTTGQAYPGAGASSQEEYDETESEEDHLLTSSTENVLSGRAAHQTPLRQVSSAQVVDVDSSEEDDDDDENATALGRRPSEPFRPQPNAFSHPPSHLLHRHSTSSAVPQHGRRPSFTRRSHTRADRRTPDFTSPNYQADNDAVLRASLTTLLSCAAAARSLPRDNGEKLGERPAPVSSGQPVALRFAPESELMAPSPPPVPSRGSAQSARTRAATPPRPEPVAGEKIKRAATPTSSSKTPRAAKKKRTAASEEAMISPTLMTWVVSAGVVVLISVVGFGAGYVIGREVGRQETLSSLAGAGNMSAAAEGGSCGREVLKSSGGTLKRFRWGSGMGRSLVA